MRIKLEQETAEREKAQKQVRTANVRTQGSAAYACVTCSWGVGRLPWCLLYAVTLYMPHADQPEVAVHRLRLPRRSCLSSRRKTPCHARTTGVRHGALAGLHGHLPLLVSTHCSRCSLHPHLCWLATRCSALHSRTLPFVLGQVVHWCPCCHAAEATNRKRPLQALSTLDEDEQSLLMSAIGEEEESEQPTSKSARHSMAAGEAPRLQLCMQALARPFMPCH